MNATQPTDLVPAAATLAAPDGRFRESYVAALREGFQRGNRAILRPSEIDEVEEDFEGYVRQRIAQTGDIVLPNGRRVERVPFSLHWLAIGDVFIGELSFRHRLNDHLRQSGGHIGYGIRPSLQNRGFGKRILALGKEEARVLGLDRLLLTCHETNPASARIIEANGGNYQNTVADIFGGGPLRRYWIEL